MTTWTPEERRDIRVSYCATQILTTSGLAQFRHRWELAHRMSAPYPALPRDLRTASRWYWELDRARPLSESDEALRRALGGRAVELSAVRRRVRK